MWRIGMLSFGLCVSLAACVATRNSASEVDRGAVIPKALTGQVLFVEPVRIADLASQIHDQVTRQDATISAEQVDALLKEMPGYAANQIYDTLAVEAGATVFSDRDANRSKQSLTVRCSINDIQLSGASDVGSLGGVLQSGGANGSTEARLARVQSEVTCVLVENGRQVCTGTGRGGSDVLLVQKTQGTGNSGENKLSTDKTVTNDFTLRPPVQTSIRMALDVAFRKALDMYGEAHAQPAQSPPARS
jgi:hypothetical protein